jgi:Tfp pilus assembly protein PilV
MIAMLVLLIGAAGVIAIYVQGQRMHADSLRATRATAIAQDLLNNLEQWPYNSSSGHPLYNRTTTNDADIGDVALHFESSADPVADGWADHGEGDLPVPYTGIPTASLGTDYQRFWNVAYPDNNAALVSVVVRWRSGSGWRRIALLSAKTNPAAVH